MKIRPTIVVDSREQTPFTFTLPGVVDGLDTGDYSLQHLTHLVAVERKSLPDLLACCGHGRDRFKRELQRLAAYRFRLVVIESTPDEIDAGRWRSTLKPSHIWGALASWTARYALPVHLGGSHESCGRFVEKYLYQCCRHIVADYTAAQTFVELTEPAGVAR